MTRIHFVDGNYLDINLNLKSLNETLDKNGKAKFVFSDDLTIVLDNVTYIETIDAPNKIWEDSNE
ncbi:MAG: hypothetical protein IKL08_06070 [Clostridia bacterium]|nr:hypothetical protein [Clostridia bacterium]